MKNKIFPIFITLFGLLTAYVFYAFWHTDELNTKHNTKKIKEKTSEDLSNKKLTPKTALVIPNIVSSPISEKTEEKNVQKEVEKYEKLIFQLPDKLEEKTQAIYDSLMPDEHEEIMAEASEAFDRLDELVSEQDDNQELIEDEVMNIENENLDYATQEEEEEVLNDEIPAFDEEEIIIE